MGKINTEGGIAFCWVGVICAAIAVPGTILSVAVANRFAMPFPQWFLPAVIVGDIYCGRFLLWRIRRLKTSMANTAERRPNG